MKNIKKMIIATIIAGLAIVSMAISGSNAIKTRAALNPSTATYNGNIEVTKIVSIGVKENSELSTKMEAGKKYKEEISVANGNDQIEYVRLIVTKYWCDAEGKKIQKDPGLIELSFGDEAYNSKDWYLNEKETTKEQSTYYYRRILEGSKESELLFDTIRINEKIAGSENKTVKEEVRTKEDGTKVTVITETFDFDGYQIHLELEAQSIQTKHADDAANSIWGNVGVSYDEDAGELK